MASTVPRLNPIKHLWVWKGQETKEELILAFLVAWNEIHQQRIDNLILRMPR